MRRSSRHAPARTLIESLEDLSPSINEEQFCVADSCLFLLLEQAATSRCRGRITNDPYSPWHTLTAGRMNAPGEDVD